MKTLPALVLSLAVLSAACTPAMRSDVVNDPSCRACVACAANKSLEFLEHLVAEKREAQRIAALRSCP